MNYHKPLFIQAVAIIFVAFSTIVCSICIHDINKRIAALEFRVTILEAQLQ
jgi:hypothetical protein